MEKIIITPQRVCCDQISVTVEGDVIQTVEFAGGCDGNGKALGRLLAGMNVGRAAQVLEGVNCEGKGTSCADQLSQGLRKQATHLITKAD